MILITLFAALASARLQQPGWQTAYEKSGYVATGRYQEAVDYCRRLEHASPYARVITFGTSPEGRPMIALVISRDRAFTPAAALRTHKPLVLINNGIHSGEIEGKDASLILAREILVTKRESSLIQHLNLLIVPVFSVDAHERFTPYNRINQNGPNEMGWRATATNLNLNRDFVKADAPEMRAMLRLVHAWKPAFFFDNHTTDGADWRYSIQYGMSTGPEVAPPVAAWSRAMIAEVQPKVEADGYLMAPYFGGFDPGRPERGISIEQFTPRYSHGYMAVINCPALLIETHMLKPYRVRVEATYSLVKRVLEYCGQTAQGLKGAIAEADNEDSALHAGTPVTLASRSGPEGRPFVFKGWVYTPYRSEVSGGMTAAWKHEPLDTPTTVRDTPVPDFTIDAPAAYAVPPAWQEVIGLLKLHGFAVSTLTAPMTDTFETYRFDSVRWAREPFESRFMPGFTAVRVQEKRELPTGTVIVRVAQPGARLLMQMLEPAAPDSLVHWGLFNTVFEQKEYFEAYSMEPIAKRLLEENPDLKAAFQEQLKDPAFAANPRARLDFIYQRSPWADTRLNKYPVVRLTEEQLRTAERGKENREGK